MRSGRLAQVLSRLKRDGLTWPKQILVWASVLMWLAALSSHMRTAAQAPPAAYANFEGAQTNPIRLSADGTRLYAVNTANASLSVFDVTTPGSPSLLKEIPVGLEPVSVNPRTKDEVWVVNQISNTISIVSVSKRIVTDTIDTKLAAPANLPAPPLVEPMDVVFVGNQAYVSVSRANTIAVFDVTTHNLITAIPLFGDNPRALAVSPDGSKVYAAFAISGNGSTMVTEGDNCHKGPNSGCIYPQPNYTNPKYANEPIPTVGVIVSAKNPLPGLGKFINYTMPDNDVAIINTGASPSLAGYYSGVGTINLGLAVNPVTGDLFVTNTDAMNTTQFQSVLCGHWVNNRITRIQVSSGTVTPVDLNPGVVYGCAPNATDLSIALAQPAGVTFDPSGHFMYVAAFGTDRVAKVDTSGKWSSFVEVAPPSGVGSNVDPANKRGPRGLALNAGAQTLYCLNRISNTISVINTATNAVSTEIPVGSDPTPLAIKQGRGFLYDAKLSGTGTGACASCHVDGDMDHLAWDLGDPGGSFTTAVSAGVTIRFSPLKGPMTTQTLRGLLNLSPYHWRGDMPDFAAFNAVFPGLMGGNQVSDADMATYTTFVNSILFPPNSYLNLDRTLPTSLPGNPGPGLTTGGNPVTGLQDFLTVPGTHNPLLATCIACHTVPPGSGSNRIIKPMTVSGQPMKLPQLRNMYQKELFNKSAGQTVDGFGFDHEGGADGLLTFMNSFPLFTQQQKQDVVAFSLCFDTGTAPTVGFTQTVTPANAGNSTVEGYWTLLQARAAAGDIDLIARGTIGGKVHGLLYQPSTNSYLSDTNAMYTQADLQNFITNSGDTLSVMGVYPGTGTTH